MEQIHDQAADSVQLHQRGSCTFLKLQGQVDLDAAARLRFLCEALPDSSPIVEIDWSAATHVGAGAVQVLLALEMALAAGGRTLRVANDNPDVRHFLEWAGLSGHFPVLEQTA